MLLAYDPPIDTLRKPFCDPSEDLLSQLHDRLPFSIGLVSEFVSFFHNFDS